MTTLVHLFLNGSSVTRTTIKAWTTLNFHQIQLLTTEFVALECLKAQCLHFFSVAINLILFKLADTCKDEMHNILDVFEFGQIGRQATELPAHELSKYPHRVIMGKMVSTVCLVCLLT